MTEVLGYKVSQNQCSHCRNIWRQCSSGQLASAAQDPCFYVVIRCFLVLCVVMRVLVFHLLGCVLTWCPTFVCMIKFICVLLVSVFLIFWVQGSTAHARFFVKPSPPCLQQEHSFMRASSQIDHCPSAVYQD